MNRTVAFSDTRAVLGASSTRIALRAAAGLALALFACACGGKSEPAQAPPPRHLVLLTIDTLRADHLSSFGGARPTTAAQGATARGSAPGFTIDELASQSVRFSRAYAPRGMTFPSLSTLFTGHPPIETCALSNGDLLPREAETLAERLSAHGFRCAAFTTNKLLVARSGIEQGFADFFTDASPERDLRAVEAASRWIAAQDLEHGPPLFVWIHLTGPHLPYDPTPIDGVDFSQLFTAPSPPGGADGSRAFLDRAHGEGRELSADELAHVVALYDGEVARIDHLVSRFARFLAGGEPGHPADLLSRSVLVFAADHGEELYERNRYFGHAKSIYEPVLRVPLFVRVPGVAAAEIAETVELEDLLPTFLELFGAGADPALRGRSLARAITAGAPLEPRPAFGLWRDRMFTVRTGRWRLVWNPEGIEPEEPPPGRYTIPKLALYDLGDGGLERDDVASAHPDVVAELQQAIRVWRAGLVPCKRDSGPPSAERMQALKDLGYVGDDH
jgi:arylsulfatase A-like enzyme